MNIFLLCPESYINSCNQLIAVGGPSIADLNTVVDPRYEDSTGNLYAINNMSVPTDRQLYVLTTLKQQGYTLTRPEWDAEEVVDMTAAQECFDNCIVFVQEYDGEGQPTNSLTDLMPCTVPVFVMDMAPETVIEQTGLTPIDVVE